MSNKEAVYIIIDPFNAYAYELMQWAFLDFGLRAIVLIEDLHGSIYKKKYSPSIPHAWIAKTFLCTRDEVESTAKHIATHYSVNGIIPWSETTVELAIELMKHLDCRWINVDVLARFRNKFRLKEFLRNEHPKVPINKSWPINSLQDLQGIKSQLKGRFVIKPVDGMSNKKIGFFTDTSPQSEFADYFSKSGDGRYVLEEYISGQEYAVNGQTDEAGKPWVYSVLKYHHKHVNGRPNVYTRSQHLSRNDPNFEVLTRYTEQVVIALGLSRCPFHAEIRIDPERGPCLVEIAARPVGNQLIQLMRDAHGQSLEPLRIACHYYLSRESFSPPALNWHQYDRTQAINVDGITSTAGLVTCLGDYTVVEASPFFRRWVVKPEVGIILGVTQDLLSQPFSFHITTVDVNIDLMKEADQLEAKIQITTDEAPAFKRFIAFLTMWKRRLNMRIELLRFRRMITKI